jgi:hypothetical protein
MCLNGTYCSVQLGTHLSDTFPTTNGFRQGDVLQPLLFNFRLEYAITRVQINQGGLILNDTHQLSVYTDGVNTGWKRKYYKGRRKD